MMWYVEAMIGDRYERWEALTKEQADAVWTNYVDNGSGMTRMGLMS